MKPRIRIDGFLLGMAAAVALAWVFPRPGAHGGALHPELLTKAGVALIFFLHGVAISFDAMRAGTLRWPLHLVVQAATFLVFPLVGLAMLRVAGRWASDDLRLGFFYLCALPSTVSSSVALTAAARGNVPAAVFNATLSSLLGVFLTPLWLGVFLRGMWRGGAAPLPLAGVIPDLLLWLVLPLAVGQLSRPWLGGWAARHKKRIGLVDRGTILLLVYTSFCDSVVAGVWSAHGARPLLWAAGSAAVLLAFMLAAVRTTCEALKFAREDRIAAVFCGSKKTLASGVPMAQLLFRGDPALSLILLPIMIYHPLQLIVGGSLAGRWGREAAVVPAEGTAGEAADG